MKSNRIDITIHWGDCDPADIVFYPQYFRWFDAGATSLFVSAGLDYRSMLARFDLVGLPILEASASFRRPSRFLDVITVESFIAQWRNTTFRVGHRIFNDGALAVEGHEIRGWVGNDPAHPNGISTRPIPDEFKAWFEVDRDDS